MCLGNGRGTAHCTAICISFGKVWGCTDTPTELSVFSRRIPRFSVGYEGCTERTEIFGRV